jgi:outer membrane immunogenic protein
LSVGHSTKVKYLCGVAGVALTSAIGVGGAQAQMPNWTGMYFGTYAGAAWARSYASTDVDCNRSPSDFSTYFCDSGTPDNGWAVNASGTGWMRDSTLIYGMQAGQNWQTGYWVYGFETDFGSLRLNGSRNATGTYPVGFGFVSMGDAYSIGTTFSTNWLTTARARLGWTSDKLFGAHDPLLIYATGGLALTDLHMAFNFSDVNGATASGSASKTLSGWALGGGLEYMVNIHWSLKAEYLHLDFGNVCASGIIDSGSGYSQGISVCANLKADIARIGVNYKL